MSYNHIEPQSLNDHNYAMTITYMKNYITYQLERMSWL